MLSRADRSSFATWWWTVDRVALITMLALVAIGLMLAFAASPAATGGAITAGDFRYAAKQIAFAAVAIFILGSVSLLSLHQLKIVAAATFAYLSGANNAAAKWGGCLCCWLVVVD